MCSTLVCLVEDSVTQEYFGIRVFIFTTQPESNSHRIKNLDTFQSTSDNLL